MVGIPKTVTPSPSSVFVLIRWLASLPPPTSHASDPLASYCYRLPAGISLPSSWHLHCPVPIAGTITAERLSSLGGSTRLLHPLRDLLYGRNSSWLRYSMVLHYLLGCS